ncbi:uncharacterized protein EV420DRAFT_1750272 [Desarmillaria tabescens]|uniref:Uncharacterized protein n=1 Tax=Armillaria tabescens TaxID=1929756 RepID=A0AA39MZ52_ARMTA|nr:uncharacterized protein EV420DRAFT_1750272 [Desarmillaria tabescens]KAK0451265.1 hypothetical protein EV420DRAFT_1750272 [Desarmillaria tabescens]
MLLHACLLNFQMSVEIGEIAKGLNHYEIRRRLQYALKLLLYSPDALNLQQVKHIGIDSRTVRLLDILRNDIHLEFPKLEHFEFSGDIEFTAGHLVKLFEYAPKLHSVALNTIHGTFFSLPSGQITTIHFANTFSLVYPSRFYNFPNATTATFEGWPDVFFGLSPIPFRRLVLRDNLPKFHRMGSMSQLTSLELVDIQCVSNESTSRQDTVYQLSRYLLKSPLLMELILTTVTIGPPRRFVN